MLIDNDVGDKIWTVRDVLSYYGQWIGDERSAIVVMKQVKSRLPGTWSKCSYSTRMRAVRDLLQEYGYKDIPFASGYRRVK